VVSSFRRIPRRRLVAGGLSAAGDYTSARGLGFECFAKRSEIRAFNAWVSCMRAIASHAPRVRKVAAPICLMGIEKSRAWATGSVLFMVDQVFLGLPVAC
jgi:hypothetical protein